MSVYSQIPDAPTLMPQPASSVPQSFDGRLPTFPGSALPLRESFRRTLLIRVVALVALGSGLLYLGWRAVATVDLMVWWVSIPLLLFELHAFIGLTLFTFSLWDVHAQPPARRIETLAAMPEIAGSAPQIVVLIPTFNEEREILLPTIAAAVALRPTHETWVLDDGDRPWVAALAADLGARYLTRPEHTHAKAGNLNHALGVLDADFLAVLDADHVAAPDFLHHTLGYFDDPRVALVQTPQDFYNRDSFEHNIQSRGDVGEYAAYHEQALFYRLLQPGKNRWGGAFWCGTGAVVRAAALREVGGVATETITEDIHTTIKLHRRGWKTVYHNEVLARGLAASNAAQYQLQRFRWGTGAMQVLRTENPCTVRGLRPTQRLAYAATLLGWFDAWRSLGYLLLPMLVLATGAVPIRADAATFLLYFGITFALQQLAMALLGRGYYRPLLATMFELIRMTPNILATLTLLRPVALRFRVTPKGREGDQRRRNPAPRLLVVAGGASVVTALWFGLTVAGLTPLQYQVPWAAYGAAFWLFVNTVLVVYAIARVRSFRYGAERRCSVRFPIALQGRFADRSCEIRDLSLTGALLVLPASAVARPGAAPPQLTILLSGTSITLDANVRSQQALGSGLLLCGVEFQPGQYGPQGRLALALFNAQLVPDIAAEPRSWRIDDTMAAD